MAGAAWCSPTTTSTCHGTASKTGISLTYTYDATGRKLARNSNGNIRYYVDGIEYDGNTIDIIHTEEGIAWNNDGTYTYRYNLSDLPIAIGIGNVRYTFDIYNGAVRRLQQDDYYAFGLRKSVAPVSEDNKYLYNGKELQDELGQCDYGARFYDPVIGCFKTIDPLAEDFDDMSPYIYALNNPILMIDPDGMAADTSKINGWPIINLDPIVIKGQSRPNRAKTLSQKFTSLEGYIPFLSEYRDYKYRGYDGSFGDYLIKVSNSHPKVKLLEGTPPGLGLGKFNPKDLLKLTKLLKNLIKKGKMPKNVKRIDVPKLDPNGKPIHGQQTHIHLKDGRAVNYDGTWKHGEGDIPTNVIKWIEDVAKKL